VARGRGLLARHSCHEHGWGLVPWPGLHTRVSKLDVDAMWHVGVDHRGEEKNSTGSHLPTRQAQEIGKVGRDGLRCWVGLGRREG
jgi:hypothetical protein